MPKATHLLWLDLESAGSRNEDPILEVGAVVTTLDPPWAELASFSRVAVPDGIVWAAEMIDVVREMHTNNGLLDEIDALRVSDPHGLTSSLWQVESDLIKLMGTFARKHLWLLAGSGVAHFDRRMITAQMPKLDKWLQYPAHDVGCIRRGFEIAGRSDLTATATKTPEQVEKSLPRADIPHRALADIRDHMREWREYDKLIQSIGRVPSRAEIEDVLRVQGGVAGFDVDWTIDALLALLAPPSPGA